MMDDHILKIDVSYSNIENNYRIIFVMQTQKDITMNMDPTDFENFYLQLKDIRTKSLLMRLAK